MSLTRRHPTPHAFRHVSRWQAHPDVVRFEPHQELVGCLPLLVYAAVVVALPMLLWAMS